jgi:endonuclease/exonuclease/phosphatase family metal-dependent hydrolase
MTGVERRSWLRKLAKAAVLLASFTVCVEWLAILTGPEHYWFSGAFLYVPFWIGLVPMVVIVGIAWPLGWRWGLTASAALLVFLWPIMGFSLGQPDAGAHRVRLMTYNIKSYRAVEEVGGFDGIIAEFRQHDPDVIVVQDAGSLFNIADPEDLQVVRDVVGAYSIYAFGQYVVASRLPLRGCKVGSISYDASPHTFVHCIVTMHGQDVDLYTAHFISPRDGLNSFRWNGINGNADWQANVQARMRQADKLARLLSQRSRPAILAGDLNAPEQSLVIRTLLDSGLRDAFSSAGLGYGYTHGHSLKPHLFSTIRIDHILVSQDIGVADCFVGGKEGSEHRPVIADLWIY